jgi:hypothetical protein
MHLRRIAVLAAFVAGLAALPLGSAKAQYYTYPPCSPFPLAWPFCVAGAVVGTAAAIVTAPFQAFAPPPYYYAYYPPPRHRRPHHYYARGSVVPPPPR